jgi:hypothetical protein
VGVFGSGGGPKERGVEDVSAVQKKPGIAAGFRVRRNGKTYAAAS